MVESLAIPTKKEELRARVHSEALLIGFRAAARKFNIKEDTVLSWAYRYKWKLPECMKDVRLRDTHKASRASKVQSHASLNALAEAIDEQGEHSRLYLSASTLQASHKLAQSAGHTEGERVPYAGLLNVARTGDTVHGWTARNTAPPQVAVQVVMPTPEERAKLDATDAMLDAITKRLTAPQ